MQNVRWKFLLTWFIGEVLSVKEWKEQFRAGELILQLTYLATFLYWIFSHGKMLTLCNHSHSPTHMILQSFDIVLFRPLINHLRYFLLPKYMSIPLTTSFPKMVDLIHCPKLNLQEGFLSVWFLRSFPKKGSQAVIHTWLAPTFQIDPSSN